MIQPLAFLAALLAQPAPAVSAPATAVGAQPAPAATAPAQPAPAVTDDPAANLEQLNQMYRNACLAREYGAYDDICDQLRQQVRQAERQAARAARRQKSAAPSSQR